MAGVPPLQPPRLATPWALPCPAVHGQSPFALRIREDPGDGLGPFLPVENTGNSVRPWGIDSVSVCLGHTLCSGPGNPRAGVSLQGGAKLEQLSPEPAPGRGGDHGEEPASLLPSPRLSGD